MRKTFLAAFYPPTDAENRWVRLSGAIWCAIWMSASAGLILSVILRGQTEEKPSTLLPMIGVITIILAGAALHRLLWGHPEAQQRVPRLLRSIISTGSLLLVWVAFIFTISMVTVVVRGVGAG